MASTAEQVQDTTTKSKNTIEQPVAAINVNDLLDQITNTDFNKQISLDKAPSEPPSESLSEPPASKKQLTYDEIISAIKEECAKINQTVESGRFNSLKAEQEYLKTLKKNLESRDQNIRIQIGEIESKISWYDIMINDIPINLKMTTATQADNAMSKKGIIYSLTGELHGKKQYSYNEMYQLIKANLKPKREIAKEYHYLVIRKTTPATILIRPILDVSHYISNGKNDLQINWKKEFDNPTYKTSDDDYKNKVIELLKTLQDSCKKVMKSFDTFLEADLSAL